MAARTCGNRPSEVLTPATQHQAARPGRRRGSRSARDARPGRGRARSGRPACHELVPQASMTRRSVLAVRGDGVRRSGTRCAVDADLERLAIEGLAGGEPPLRPPGTGQGRAGAARDPGSPPRPDPMGGGIAVEGRRASTRVAVWRVRLGVDGVTHAVESRGAGPQLLKAGRRSQTVPPSAERTFLIPRRRPCAAASLALRFAQWRVGSYYPSRRTGVAHPRVAFSPRDGTRRGGRHAGFNRFGALEQRDRLISPRRILIRFGRMPAPVEHLHGNHRLLIAGITRLDHCAGSVLHTQQSINPCSCCASPQWGVRYLAHPY